MTESWRAVPWATHYQVSDLGRVRNPYGLILKPRSNHGHPAVILRRHDPAGESQHQVARLVLEAFVGPCPGDCRACHYDLDTRNNVLGNLGWETPAFIAKLRAMVA